MKITLSPRYSKPSWVKKYGLLWYSINVPAAKSGGYVECVPVIKEFTKTKTHTTISNVELSVFYYDWDVCKGNHEIVKGRCKKCRMEDDPKMRQQFPEVQW